MTLKQEWLVVCDRVVEDVNTRSLSMLGTIERISSIKFPALHHGFAFATSFVRDGGAPPTESEYDFRLSRRGASGEENEILAASGKLTPQLDRIRWYHNFPFLRLFEPETLTFRVDWREKGADWSQGQEVTIQVLPSEVSPALLENIAKLQREGFLPTEDPPHAPISGE